MRIADFGRLHRYERTGVVQGLTRVRTFAQDDAHIFCTLAQMQAELIAFMNLLHAVYQDFGFTDNRVVIATRPEHRLGGEEVWNEAERALKVACETRGLPYEIAEGEGAFYGPKVEFHLRDALGRPWQLGTIQVDFNLPERFDVNYVAEDGERHRPAMIHRTLLGSMERFVGGLVEHYAGAFPAWLAPQQVAIIPITDDQFEVGREIATRLKDAGLRVEVDTSSGRMQAKIRNAQLQKVPYMLVLGKREAEAGTVAVRLRSGEDLGAMPVQQFLDLVLPVVETKSLSLTEPRQSGEKSK
jgi:threonyl-tRNA synthetase